MFARTYSLLISERVYFHYFLTWKWFQNNKIPICRNKFLLNASGENTPKDLQCYIQAKSGPLKASRTTVAEQLVSYSIIASDESSRNTMAASTEAVALRRRLHGTVWRRLKGCRPDLWLINEKSMF